MNRFYRTIPLFVIIVLSISAGYRTVILKVPGNGIIELPDSFVVAASESLHCDGEILPRSVYSIDYFRGRIVIKEPIACDSLLVSYSYIELRLPSSVQRRVPRGSGGQLAPIPTPRKNLGMFPEGGRLMHSGSLFRGIKVGSGRDPTMESAFQLEAYGGIGENVEITAVLSDQDLPIQPEGTSEKIAQLDQVYIGVTAPHFAATFGDFATQFALGGEFTSYSRRLSGVQIEVYSDPASAEAVGAILEGVWASDEFYGSEGDQGPYSLSIEGKSSIQVLAGTETVWLDGEKLKRGADNDYTIDYNLGQITFTPNRPIGAQSRIVVDFQYTDIDFRRSFYGVSGGLNPHNAIKFYFAGMSELDDPDNPLATDFGEGELEALSAAGDCADSAYVWGAVLSDSGDYALVDSATDSAHFEWVGEGEGSWEVTFTNVGSGNGEYEYAGAGQYEYVGPGEGDYAPRMLLPMPASHSVLDLGLEFVPLGGVTLSAEMAASNLDRNRLSEAGDDDNSDQAYNFVLNTRRALSVSGRSLGSAQLTARYRLKGERFAAIGRLDDAEFQRDWGIESVSGAEQLAEMKIVYAPWQSLSLSGSYGSNEIGTQRSARYASALSLDTPDWKCKTDFSRTENGARWDKIWGTLSGKVWIFSPSAGGRFENNEKSGGFRFWESDFALGISPLSWLTLTPGFERREDESRDSSGLSPESRTTAYKLSGGVGKWDFQIYHREYEALTESGTDVLTDLAELNGSFRTSIPQTAGRVRYELSRNRSEVLEPYYTYVGDGSGNYEFDEGRGEFVPSVGGDYLKEYRSTGEFTPVVSSDVRANLSIKTGKIKGDNILIKVLRMLSADGLIQSEGQTERTDAHSLLLDPREMLADDELVMGNFLAEGNLRIGFGPSRQMVLRRRYSKFRSTQFTTGEEFRWTDSRSVEGRSTLGIIGNWHAKTEWTRQARLYPGSSRTGTDLSGTEFSLFWTRSLGEKIRLTADGSYLSQTDKWPEEPVEIARIAVSPGGTYFIGKGTIRWSAQYSRVFAENDTGLLPYEMAHGDWVGDNGLISLIININIAKGTLLTTSYTLESHTGRLPEHTGEARVRLTF